MQKAFTLENELREIFFTKLMKDEESGSKLKIFELFEIFAK